MSTGAPGPNALAGAAKGVVAVAALWVGLAMFMSAWVYATSYAVHMVLAIVGAWLSVAGIGYVYGWTTRPPAAA